MTDSVQEQVGADRARMLAAEVETIADELRAIVLGSSEEQWTRSTTSERWPIAVVAHHVSEVAAFFTQVIAAAREGSGRETVISADDIEQNNARHAVEYAAAGQAEVEQALRQRIAALVAEIRRLNDQQLGHAAGVFAGSPLTIGQAIELGVIGHFREHLASIRAALAA